MVSFCNCKLCREIRERTEKEDKYKKCPYCREHHDERICCPARYNQKKDISSMFPAIAQKLIQKIIITSTPLYEGESEIEKQYKKSKTKIDPKNCEYYINLENGKYIIYLQNKPYEFEALRHNEKWRNLCGDNLILALVHEIIRLEELRKKQWKIICSKRGIKK